MMEGDPLKRLLNNAARLLARRAYSRGELRDKLLQSADNAIVDNALVRLEELRLLNDAVYAYNFALRRIKSQSWGPIRVKHALLQRQVAPALVDSAIEQVRKEISDDFVLEQYLDKYCRHRGQPQERSEIHRLILRLRRGGFDEDAIFRTLKKRVPAKAWMSLDLGE